MDKTEWVAIVTSGADGPNLVATWGEYVRTIGMKDGEVIIIPLGPYHKTARQGEIQIKGEIAEMVKAKIPYVRGILVIKVEEVRNQL